MGEIEDFCLVVVEIRILWDSKVTFEKVMLIIYFCHSKGQGS